MTLAHVCTIPVLRSFDEARAKEFFIQFLGFQIDFEHRFEPDLPLFMQVSRGGIVFYVSEHFGNGSPGVQVTVKVTGLKAFHAELVAKKYGNARPGLRRTEWGSTEMTISDPAGNRLNFVEDDED